MHDKPLQPTRDAAIAVPRHGYRIDPRKALIVSALCWAGFVWMVWLVLTHRSGTFDSAGLLLWRNAADLTPRGHGWLLEAVRDVTALGGVLLRNLIALGAIVALLFLKLRREAALLGLTIASGWIVNSLLKMLVGRDRPELVPHLMDAGGKSFPSGHSFNSAVVFIAIALAFAAISPRHSVRWTLIASAIAIAVLVALSRVWLGVHFPSDVAAGVLGGSAWAFMASALLQRPAKALEQQGEAA